MLDKYPKKEEFMRKITTIIAATLFLTLTVTAGVSFAYMAGYTLEETPTGFATLSNEQSHSPNTSVKMGTVDTDDIAQIAFSGSGATQFSAALLINSPYGYLYIFILNRIRRILIGLKI
jgi:hypothetical protein